MTHCNSMGKWKMWKVEYWTGKLFTQLNFFWKKKGEQSQRGNNNLLTSLAHSVWFRLNCFAIELRFFFRSFFFPENYATKKNSVRRSCFYKSFLYFDFFFIENFFFFIEKKIGKCVEVFFFFFVYSILYEKGVNLFQCRA